MKKLPAVQASLISDEAHVAFIKTAKETGKHDYSTVDQGVIYSKKEE